jgi:hypothetical protein
VQHILAAKSKDRSTESLKKATKRFTAMIWLTNQNHCHYLASLLALPLQYKAKKKAK